MSTMSSSKSNNGSSELEDLASGTDDEVDNDGGAADESKSAGGSSAEDVKRADDDTENLSDDDRDHEVKHAGSSSDCRSDGGSSGDDAQESMRTDRCRESTPRADEKAPTDDDSLDAPPDVGVSRKVDPASINDVVDESEENQEDSDVFEDRESRGGSDTREDTHVTDTRDVGWDHEEPRNMTINDEDGVKIGANETSSCSKDKVGARSREHSPSRSSSNLTEVSRLGLPAGGQASSGNALDGKVNPPTPPSESGPRDEPAVTLSPGDRRGSNDARHEPIPATTTEARDDTIAEFNDQFGELRESQNDSQIRETTPEYHAVYKAQEAEGILRAKTPAEQGVGSDQGASVKSDLRGSIPANRETRRSCPDGDGTAVCASSPRSYLCASQGDGDDTDGEDAAGAFYNSSGDTSGTNACEAPMPSPRVVDGRENRSSDDTTGRNGHVEQQVAGTLIQTAAEKERFVEQDSVQPASGTDSKRPSGEPFANTGDTTGDMGREEKPGAGRLAAHEEYGNYRSSDGDEGAESRSGTNDREITGPRRGHNIGYATRNRRVESRIPSPGSIVVFAPGTSPHAISCSSSPPAIEWVSPGKAAATAAATAAAASVRAAEAAVDAAEAAKVAADVEEQASPARSGFSVARDSSREDGDQSLRGSPKALIDTLAPMKRDYENDVGRGRRQGRFNRGVLDAGAGDRDGNCHRLKNIGPSEDEKLKRAREQVRIQLVDQCRRPPNESGPMGSRLRWGSRFEAC